MKQFPRKIEELRAFYVGKDSFYYENWSLLHLKINDIDQFKDNYLIRGTIFPTPGFTSSNEKQEIIFEDMTGNFLGFSGSGYGPGIIRRIESLESLQSQYELMNIGKAWPNNILNRHSAADELRLVHNTAVCNYRYFMAKKLILEPMRKEEPQHQIEIADAIINSCDSYIKWPKRSLLFMPGINRGPKFFNYEATQLEKLKNASIKPDRRNNGPAIMAYLLAGGERPKRHNNHGWSIHHIYDGNFPLSDSEQILHAVKDPDHFTQSAGLVALHSIADGLASESRYFAWYLRLEAMRRFNYAPFRLPFTV